MLFHKRFVENIRIKFEILVRKGFILRTRPLNPAVHRKTGRTAGSRRRSERKDLEVFSLGRNERKWNLNEPRANGLKGRTRVTRYSHGTRVQNGTVSFVCRLERARFRIIDILRRDNRGAHDRSSTRSRHVDGRRCDGPCRWKNTCGRTRAWSLGSYS